MMGRKKLPLTRAHGFQRELTSEDLKVSQELLMKSSLYDINSYAHPGSNGSSYNFNNNGKHKHYRRLSSDFDGKAESKGILKTKKHKGKKGDVLSPTSRRASVELFACAEGAVPLSAKRRSSVKTSDMDDIFMFPAEYPLSMSDYSRRRSSAHRVSYKKAIQKAGYNMNEIVAGSTPTSSGLSSLQSISSQCLTEIDWSESTVPDHHIWSPSNASGDLCYVGEQHCQKSGPRKKCNACHIVIHENCYSQLLKIGFKCKVTFREASSRNTRENLVVHHHWVHRRKLEGKCRQCGKSFEKRFGFREPTKIIAISCSWCKEAYHNKVSCFQMHKIKEPCTLGCFGKSIVQPTWIIKTSQKQKSVRNRSKKKKMPSGTWRKRSTKESSRPKTFIIRPLSQQAAFVSPTLVFINPKSGGKQGYKLMQQFQWHMNPRQIWDLSKGNPEEALELYRKVPNLRLLTCGGDGTVGWILSVLDKMNLPNAPPVGILPLGTGNDLSRTLNFGPGYSESDSISKIIQGVEDARMVKLDRWKLTVERNEDKPKSVTDEEALVEGHHGVDELPINLVNNYFSIGFDAKVTLNFHNSREAKPEKFTSRIGNKMFYARSSVLEYMTREAKDLYRNISLFCDGIDYTQKIRELKPVCILFLNIPRYSSGCAPWGNPTGGEFKAQCIDDKLIEVLAFGVHQLGMVVVGGHGDRICQCRSAVVKINKAYPVQIDGEPCLLNPSTVKVDFFNQTNMLYKSKRRGSVVSEPQPSQEQIKIRVNMVSSQQFDDFNGQRETLCSSSTPLLVTVVMNQSTLDTVRACLLLMMNEGDSSVDPLSEKWIFLDSSSADKFYKIDVNREHLLAVSDVTDTDREVYILDLTENKFQSANTRQFSRNQLVDRQSVLRNRVQSDSGVLSSASGSFSSMSKSEITEDNFKFPGADDADIPDPTSTLLDVVFEQPELSEAVQSVKSDALTTSSPVNSDVNENSHSSAQAKPLPATISTLLQDEARCDSDCSSYSTSSNEYLLFEDQRSSPSLLLRSPLKPSLSSPHFPPDQVLPAEFASQLTFEESNGKKNKKKVHKRSSTDTDPKKTAGFTHLPSQLLGLVSANKNHSNNTHTKSQIKGIKRLLSHEGVFFVSKDNKGSSEQPEKIPSENFFKFSASKSENATAKTVEEPAAKPKPCTTDQHRADENSSDKLFLDASKCGDLEKMTSSLRQGTNLCVCDDEGCTALHHAARFSHPSIVDYLLQQGETKLLDMTCHDRNQTALHKAAWYKRGDICEKLANAGASLDLLDYKGMTALDRAKQADDLQIVEFLTKFQETKQDDRGVFETDL